MDKTPKIVPCQDSNKIHLLFSLVNHKAWGGKGTTSFEMGGLNFKFNYFGTHKHGDNAEMNDVLDINNHGPDNPETYNHVACLTRDAFTKYTGRKLPEYYHIGGCAPS